MYFAKFREVLMARVNIFSRFGSLMTNNLIHLSSFGKSNVCQVCQVCQVSASQTFRQVSSRAQLQAEKRSILISLRFLRIQKLVQDPEHVLNCFDRTNVLLPDGRSPPIITCSLFSFTSLPSNGS